MTEPAKPEAPQVNEGSKENIESMKGAKGNNYSNDKEAAPKTAEEMSPAAKQAVAKYGAQFKEAGIELHKDQGQER